MSNYTVFEGMTFKFKLSVPPVTGTITINPFASTYINKVTHKGQRAFNKIAVFVNGATNGTCTQTILANGNIPANSIKNKSENKKFVLDNADSGVITINGQTGGGSPCSFTTTVEINNPANDKVKMV